MSEPVAILSSIEYYNYAKKALEEKDLLGFVSNVNSAVILSNNDEDLLMLHIYKRKGFLN